jgi:hypothetical protein
MVGPLGVLPAGPAAATIGVGDVNGGPPGGCCRQVRQWPPPELETSMAGPLGVLPAGLAAATTRVGDVDGGPPRGPLLLAAMSSFQWLAGSPARLLSYRCSPSAVATGPLWTGK